MTLNDLGSAAATLETQVVAIVGGDFTQIVAAEATVLTISGGITELIKGFLHPTTQSSVAACRESLAACCARIKAACDAGAKKCQSGAVGAIGDGVLLGKIIALIQTLLPLILLFTDPKPTA